MATYSYTRTTLTDHPYMQCSVRLYDDGTIVFQSYATDVAEITTDAYGYRWLVVTGTYSATTRKQLGYFMREYLQESYQLAKWVYEHGVRYCVDTGEVQDL